MTTSFQIKSIAHKCWYVTSSDLVSKLFKGPVSESTVREVLEATPEIKDLLPPDEDKKAQVYSSVFQALQERIGVLDQLPAFIESHVPQHEDPALQLATAWNFLEQVRQQMEESVIPPLEVMLTGDIQQYKNYLADVIRDDSLRKEIPFERLLGEIIKIVGDKTTKEQKTQFLDRLRQIFSEDLPTDRNKMLLRLKEIIWTLNTFAEQIIPTSDKLRILRVLDEELEQNPELMTLYKQLDGDVDKLITTVFLAYGASSVMKKLGQDSSPRDFYPIN
ncbi:MAG: hypothetical protein HYY52_00735 [Candidatus Melainabacteria bacterium]|nr:hypothetical protein [Candidatus Melainabacteria bacterium]